MLCSCVVAFPPPLFDFAFHVSVFRMLFFFFFFFFYQYANFGKADFSRLSSVNHYGTIFCACFLVVIIIIFIVRLLPKTLSLSIKDQPVKKAVNTHLFS